jgi:5-methylcytosine-specific restriction endonuclease McrA
MIFTTNIIAINGDIWKTLEDLKICRRIEHKVYLALKYGSICQMCREYYPDLAMLTTDHIIPKKEGGSIKLENKQLLCIHCHDEKTRSEHIIRSRK